MDLENLKTKNTGSNTAVVNANPFAEQFDPDSLRLTQDFGSIAGVEKVLTTVRVGKPSKQIFFRVHPDEKYRLQTATLDLKEENEHFLVDKSLWSELGNELTPKCLFAAIDRSENIFIIPTKLTDQNGKFNSWNASMLQAMQIAMTSWVRLQSNMSLGAYEVTRSTGIIEEPKWPVISFSEILQIAFKDKFINNLDHPVVRRLRGKV